MSPQDLHESILGSWGENWFFLDLHILRSHGGLSTNELLGFHADLAAVKDRDLFGVRKCRAIPVIRIRDIIECKDVSRIRSTFQEIALRVAPEDLDRPAAIAVIKNALLKIRYRLPDVHLLLDFGHIWTRSANFGHRYDVLKRAPWRSVTFLAGSFPKDLSDLKGPGRYELQRLEYQAWREFVYDGPGDVIPSFGDYTIQHPTYSPPAGGGANVSASIRYAKDDRWVIMRGTMLKLAGATQYLSQASLLVALGDCDDSGFSSGDRYVHTAAEKLSFKRTDSPGNATTWLRAGINRHLELTAVQVTSLAHEISERLERAKAISKRTRANATSSGFGKTAK